MHTVANRHGSTRIYRHNGRGPASKAWAGQYIKPSRVRRALRLVATGILRVLSQNVGEP